MFKHTICNVAIILITYFVFSKGQSFEAWILPGEAEFLECTSVRLLDTYNESYSIHLLHFDIFLQDGGFGVLPVGFIVTGAQLLIPESNVNRSVSLSLYDVETPWTNTTEWSSYPNNQGPVSGLDYLDTEVGTYNGINDKQFTNISVYESVFKWSDPANINRGWLIKTPPGPLNYTCNSSSTSSPILSVTFTPLPVRFTCFTYKDPLGEFPYHEPFIAYTRLCTFCTAPFGFGDYVRDLQNRNDGTVTVNGVQVFTRNTKPINGTDIGFCINMPPGLNITRVEIQREVLDATKGIRVAMDTLGYTTLLPDQIGCQTFDCENTTVVIDGDIKGNILDSDTVVIRSDVTIVGDFNVEGSISIESNNTVLEVEGCMTATRNISISLQNETYREGQVIMEVFAHCNMEQTNFVLDGGQTEVPCEHLRVNAKSTSRGVLLTITVDNNDCDSASDPFDSSLHIIIPVVVCAVVIIAILVGVAIYLYRCIKLKGFSVKKAMMSQSRSIRVTEGDSGEIFTSKNMEM